MLLISALTKISQRSCFLKPHLILYQHLRVLLFLCLRADKRKTALEVARFSTLFLLEYVVSYIILASFWFGNYLNSNSN